MFGWFAHNSTSASRSGRARLRLEALEDRTVPSADPLEPPPSDPLPPTEETAAPPPAEPLADPSALPELSGWTDWTEEDWQWFELYVTDFQPEDDPTPPDEAPAPETAPSFTPPA